MSAHYTGHAVCVCGHRLALHAPPTLVRDLGRCLRRDCDCATYHWRATSPAATTSEEPRP